MARTTTVRAIFLLLAIAACCWAADSTNATATKYVVATIADSTGRDRIVMIDPKTLQMFLLAIVRTVLDGDFTVFSEELIWRRIFNGTQVQT